MKRKQSPSVKHGMQLRSRSGGSVSPAKNAVKKKPLMRKKNPSSPAKKDSPPPVIIRPDSPAEAHSSETMVLGQKQKPSPQSSPREKLEPPVEKEKFHMMRRRLEYGRKLENKSREPREYLPTTGFTVWESNICGPYMWKRDYEFLDPIPGKYQHDKDFMDQVRATRGYGVTVQNSGISSGSFNHGFSPLMGKLESDPKIRELAEEMIKMVLGGIKRKMKKTYTSRGVEKLVNSSRKYFLTLGVSDPTGTPQVVEALFHRLPMGSYKNFNLLEWRINQGSELVFTTAEIRK